jgi:hypothetical protein
VVIDSFSHAVELFPLKRATAEAVTMCLHDVLCRWGKPHQVRHDNAKACDKGAVSKGKGQAALHGPVLT